MYLELISCRLLSKTIENKNKGDKGKEESRVDKKKRSNFHGICITD